MTLRHLANTATPLAITRAYRRFTPMAIRHALPGPGTSTRALELIAAGGGWSAFFRCALPRITFSAHVVEVKWFVPQGYTGMDVVPKISWFHP